MGIFFFLPEASIICLFGLMKAPVVALEKVAII
jgi:hypothetical protein